MVEKSDKKVSIPGEIIVEGEDYLPGEGTEKIDNKIIALKYGLVEESKKLVRIIPLSGVYQPRRGNVVIGVVTNITFNGWVIDINTPESSFLPLMEVPRFINKHEIDEVMDIGDMVVCKIFGMSKRGIDLTLKSRELGRIDEGLIIKINPNKVPRVIGKEGSMVNMIKEKTKCNITVGQNGLIWIKGNNIEDELFAKRAIFFVSDKSFISGLTEELRKLLEEKEK